MGEKTYSAVADLAVYRKLCQLHLEVKLPINERRWHVAEDYAPYGSETEPFPPGWPPDT